MNQCTLLVHFEGKNDWCAFVQTANFESLMVIDVSQVALARYNNVFHTNYNITQCKIGVIHNLDDNVIMINDPSKEEITSSNMELVIKLPEQAPIVEHILSQNDYILFTRQALYYSQKGHFSAALECYRLLKRINSPPSDQLMMQFKYFKGFIKPGFKVIEEGSNRSGLTLRFPRHFPSQEPSMEFYIQKCHLPTTSYKELKQCLKEISKKDPGIAFDILLRQPRVYPYIAKLCSTSKHFRILIQRLKTYSIRQASFDNFFEAFLVHATLPQILFFFAEIKDTFGFGEPSSVGRHYAHFLLMNRDLAKLHEVLMKYFKGNRTFGVCNYNLNIFYAFLEKYKRNRSSVPSQLVPPSDLHLMPQDLSVLEVLMITAIFLFIRGDVDYFIFLVNFIEPFVTFEANQHFILQSSYINLLTACLCSSNLLTESVKMTNSSVFILGDDCAVFCANRCYEGIGCVDCHLLDKMQIAFFKDEISNTIKEAFWNRINEIEKYDVLVLVLGNTDFRVIIPKLYALEIDLTFQQIFQELITIYIKAIEKIHKTIPKVHLVIHEVFDSVLDMQHCVRQFNKMLREKLPSYVNVIRMPENRIKTNDFSTFQDYYANFRSAVIAAKSK